MSKSTETAREGGREAAEPLTSGISGGDYVATQRNSSGSATHASIILQLRQRVLELETVLIESGLLDENAITRLTRTRMQGFRRGR